LLAANPGTSVLMGAKAGNCSRPRSPVVFLGGGVGDYLIALPAVNALARLFPGQLTVAYSSEGLGFLFDNLPLRLKLPLKLLSRTISPAHFDVQCTTRQIGMCDLFLSLVPWYSHDLKSLVERLAPAQSIGFQPQFQVDLGSNVDMHAMDLAFSVPRMLDPSLDLSEFAYISPLPLESQKPVQVLKQFLPRGTRILAAHLDTRPAKMWPACRSAEALIRFLNEHPDFVAVLVGILPHPLSSEFDQRVISWAGMPLLTSLQLVAESDLFLGVDSCFLHAADLYRTPGVGLFGPTQASNWSFRIGSGVSIQGPGSLDSIAVDQVLEALETILSASAQCGP
jgi:hypothetical protein